MEYLWWSLILLGLGLAFLVLEFFVPSGGVLGVLCGLAIIGSIIVGFLASLTVGASVLITALIAVPLVLGLGVRFWPETSMGKQMLIQRPESSDEVLPTTEGYRGLNELIGHRGLARSVMMPSGVVEIDNRQYDAVSAGMPIDPGQPVIVMAVETQRLVVRPDNTTIVAQLAEGASTDPLAAEIADPFAEEPLL
jgi:membrane-bound ClpP family serine protease